MTSLTDRPASARETRRLLPRKPARVLGPRRAFTPSSLSDHSRLLILAALALIALVGYLTLNARGQWDFVLAFRGRSLSSLVVVAVAIATSSVVFQTITENRIL